MSDAASSPVPEAEGRAAAETAANPWPGLASYTESERHLFFGRSAEIGEVTRLVQRETLTVLFGRSGLGKSSLLRAGVMPRLREQGYFPVTLRLDFSERAEVSPVEQVKALTVAAARAAGVEPEGMPDDAAKLTLWEWFHTVEFWGPRNDPVTPILALDQFEEVFTLGRNLPRTDDFLEGLADLIENRVPQSVRDRAQASGQRLACDAARQDYKVILSLREDFVPRLDSLRPVLPAIMRNRFALAPLAAASACGVVLGAGGRFVSGEDAQQIVAAVVGGDGPLAYRPDEEVEPAYLSVMCHELFRRMQALGRTRITRDLIDAERGGILEGLYTRSFEGIGDPVRFFVEDRLLTPSGYRGTLPLDDATQEGIAEADLRTLVDRRLLRFEDRLGTIHLELSHDLLTRIVLKRRESRRAEAALRVETERAQKFRAAQLAQRRRSRFVTGLAVALVALLLTLLWGGYYCYIQEHRAFYRNVGTRRGFPEGIGELSPGETRRLPLHYVLVYKGIVWDGWRPHWRPAFKMMAADQRGRLTLNHGTGTYLWRAHDQAQSTEPNKDLGTALGLGTVCQWEFSADAEGGIAFARGLDLDGRMVWGCVYAPAAAGVGTTRIAHYIGPDGFPQLQNTSAAEYIEIHYDADGWESRVLFLDAMARPAVGPDGEFGTERHYDRQGKLDSFTVFDDHGRPALDRLGNAGMRVVYGANGQVEEVTAVGTDGKPLAVADGWTRLRHHYDDLGRRTLIEAFDGEGRPVLRRGNFHAVRSTYNGDGNLMQETFLGIDGQPRRIVGEVVAIRHELDAEGNEARTTFLDAAGQPARLRDGSCGCESRFDARGNLLARTSFGPDGQPFLVTDGYAGWRSEFDDQSREVRRRYQGVVGEPVVVRKGYHGWETRYDVRGNPVRYTYLGPDGRPAFAAEQVAGWEADFDLRGRETARRYLGPAGEPVVGEGGYHATATSYDERGYAADFTFLDLEGNPVVPASSRYSSRRMQHDIQGRETQRAFYGLNDKPVANKEGIHGYTYRYDALGNVIETTTVNSDNLPVVPVSQTYAREVRRYDSRGYQVEQRFYDAAGSAAKNGTGAYGVRSCHDDAGNWTEETYVASQGDEPAVDREGVSRRAYAYDAWGRQTGQAAFGPGGEPVPGVEGAFAKASRYDVNGNWLGATWLDASGRPMTNRDGFVNLRITYDERGNLATQAYFDAADQPCAGGDKTHRWVKKYDGRRLAVSWEFFDTQDHLMVGVGGYAAVLTEHEPSGRETSKTFLGADGKPLLQKSGWATIRQAYSSTGLLTRTEYYDAAGRPALGEGGYCAVSYKHDAAGQKRSAAFSGLPGLTAFTTEIETYVAGNQGTERYLDADENLVNSSAGYAQMNVEYDEAGGLQRVYYRDAHGRPAYGPYGTTGSEIVKKSFRYYNLAGESIRDTEHLGTRPLLYVNFVRSADSVAARSGLLPGDLIWQTGNFVFPQQVEDGWGKFAQDDPATEQLNATWQAALTPGTATPVRVIVVRGGRLVELTVSELPAAGIGLRTDIRLIPVRDYYEMVRRYGKPDAGSAAPAPAS